MTPFQARLSVFGSLLLVAGIAVNAMFLQRAPASAKWGANVADTRWPDAAKVAGQPSSGGSTVGSAGKRTVPARIVDGEPVVGLARVEGANVPSNGDANDLDAGASNSSRAKAQTSNPIAAVQRELTNRGYEPGPIDGIVGMMTRAAVMAYEFDEGMPISGEPHERLLKRMIFGGGNPNRGSSPARPASDHARRITKGVQELLARLGYGAGLANGELDAGTRQAIRAFERDHGMAPTGRVSGRLISQISRAGNVRLTIAAEWN